MMASNARLVAPAVQGQAKILILDSVVRAEAMSESAPPGSSASAYIKCIDEGTQTDFASLMADASTNAWLLYAIEGYSLVFIEFADLNVKLECYRGEAFLDRGVRKLVADGARIAVVSVDTVEKWIENNDAAEMLGLEGANTVWVANTGRCGSTLMHKVLLASPDVVSLSEPHYIDQFTMGRSGHEDEELARTLRVCCTIDWELARRSCFPNAKHFSINPKSAGATVQLAFAAAFPQGKHIFMYRAAHKVVESFGSIISAQTPLNSFFVSTLMSVAWTLGIGLPSLPPYATKVRSTLSSLTSIPVAFLSARWFDAVLGFLVLVKPVLPDTLIIRMDEFVRAETRTEVVSTVLDHLNIDKTNIKAFIDVFDQDSQKGSSMSRSKGDMPKFLTEKDRNHIRDVCLVSAFADMPDLVSLEGENILLKGSLAAKPVATGSSSS